MSDESENLKNLISEWEALHFGNTGFTANNGKVLLKMLKSLYGDPVGLQFTCNSCGEPITKPGGLFFSSPSSSSCKKFHICVECMQVFVKPILRFPDA